MPLFATQRTPSRRTDGGQVAAVADMLGTPLMPWQRLAADIALERLDDGTYAHQVVVISVPRQSGKTTLLRAIAVQKMLTHRRREIYYTAQTGKDARARWQQLVEQLETSPAGAAHWDVKKSAGSPEIKSKRSGSKFAAFAPTPESLHGYTPHDVMVDEAFALKEDEGRLLLGAIIPAQSTIRDRQLYIVSTKGTSDSTFLNDWIEAGRRGDQGVALVEYAAGEDVDAYDPEAWWTFHPALGISIEPDVIQLAANQMPRSEFERAYANRSTLVLSHLVDAEEWIPLASTDKPLQTDAFALTYDVAHDLTSATILASWVERDGAFGGILRHRIIKRAPGIEWLVDDIIRLKDELEPALIGADDGGPARSITGELIRRGVDVKTTTAAELGTAFARWMTRIAGKRLRHDGTAEFWTAVAALVTRPVGDVTVPSRRNSPADISPAVAAIVAGFLLEALEPPEVTPTIRVPGELATSA